MLKSIFVRGKGLTKKRWRWRLSTCSYWLRHTNSAIDSDDQNVPHSDYKVDSYIKKKKTSQDKADEEIRVENMNGEFSKQMVKEGIHPVEKKIWTSNQQ